MFNIQNYICRLYSKKSLKIYFIYYIISIVIFNISMVPYYVNQSSKVIKDIAINNFEYLQGEITPPNWLLSIFPWFAFICGIIKVILAILFVSLLLELVFTVLNKNVVFNDSLKIIVFSQLPFVFQAVLLSGINIIFKSNKYSIMPIGFEYLELINPFFIIQLYILYVILNRKIKINSKKVMILLISFIIFRMIGFL